VASYRFAARPRWVVGHVLVLAAMVTMVLLGRWQLLVSDRKHFDLQNFGYALQWWAFTVFALLFWLKILHDHAAGRAAPESGPASQAASQGAEPEAEPQQQETYRRYVMPTSNPAMETDPEVARYNAYLASLAERDDR
jgi:DNA-binding transcriptional regulator of glucitol operon